MKLTYKIAGWFILLLLIIMLSGYNNFIKLESTLKTINHNHYAALDELRAVSRMVVSSHMAYLNMDRLLEMPDPEERHLAENLGSPL